MTSIPPVPGNQNSKPSAAGSQGQTPGGLPTGPAPTAPRSYASATKKSFSQAAAGDSANKSASAPIRGPQHGKSSSTSQLNGKPTNMQNPSAPGVGGPTVVNGNLSTENVRKGPVTIAPGVAPPYLANGGPIPGRTSGIRFGVDGSPMMQNAVLANQQSGPLGIPPNNRITSPDASPSPIPQAPVVSGGRPPSFLTPGPGGMHFGNFNNDTNRHGRPDSHSMPNNPVMAHSRRESAHSAHGDVSHAPSGPNRGGFHGQGGRGRNFNQPQAYSPNQSFRTTATRGNPHFGPRHGPPPHQVARGSPSLANANPATPPMPHVPMAASSMQGPQYGYPMQHHQGYYDTVYYQNPSYPYMQMQMPGHHRPHFQPSQPGFMPGQPFIPANPLSHETPLQRSGSQQSAATDRPASRLSHGQPPSAPVTQGPSHAPNRSTSSPAPPSFIVPPKKQSHSIKITNPESGSVLTFDKQASSPARATPSPAKPGLDTTPSSTPPPRTASRGDQEHAETRAQTIQSFHDRVRLAAEQAASEEQKAKDTKKSQEKSPPLIIKSTPEPVKSEEPAKPEPTAEPAKEEPKVAQEPKKEELKPAEAADEIDFDAIEREMAAKEAEELAKEKAYEEKKQKAKEEAARKAKEEAAAYEANMKKAEQEAEAAEEARLKKLAAAEDSSKKEKADAFAALKPKAAVETPSTPATAGSGARTPVSDISMGPPKSLPKREKPAALKLETSKTVEPPQPSAALKSLQTARFLEDPSKTAYPPSIASPNPALNANAPADRKFKYNKEFLLQFQNVFKEKPSLDWETKIRETVGDNSGLMSAKTPGLSKNPSRAGAGSNTFHGSMGNFTGTSQRPPMQTGSLGGRHPTVPGQFAFGRPGGFQTMPPGSRTNSTNAQSPRSGSQRGNRSASKAQRTKKEEETNKSMPLTAGLKFEPLAPSTGGWKPKSVVRAQNLAGPDGHLPPDVVQGKVKSNLNKMTPEKFDKISDQILAIVAQSKDESDGRTLRQVIQLTFEKATDEAHWASLYARFCMRMLESMSPDIKDENIKDKNGVVVCGGSLFRKYLLNRCQEEFERGWKVNLPPKPEGTSDEAAMLSDEYYIAAAAKRRGLGLVKFIGELFKLGMLSDRIMHECVKKLVDYEGVPDEAEIESLTSLLRTVGGALERSEFGHMRMNAYFERIEKMVQTPGLPSRLTFMLMDIIDLRKAKWISKDADKGPKTIQEIREQAARAQQEAEMERKRQMANRNSSGLPLGRGDARNMSGGYGNQPPLDYASSKVGTDDLRRLKNSRTTNQPTAFAPSGLLGSRSSSRRTMGPGGNLVRGNEDSTASSRTGTPTGKKDDKESASSVNAFSALAGLDTGDSLATSPPSNPSSPQMKRSRPVAAQSANAQTEDGK